MYMQALLGPAMVGRHLLLMQVTLDSLSEKDGVVFSYDCQSQFSEVK